MKCLYYCVASIALLSACANARVTPLPDLRGSAEVSTATLLDGDDIETILNTPAKREVYINCLQGNGNCTKDGKKLKEVFSDVLQRGYTGVDNIRKAAKRFIKYMAEQISELWSHRGSILDPFGITRTEFYKNVKNIVGKPLKWRPSGNGDDEEAKLKSQVEEVTAVRTKRWFLLTTTPPQSKDDSTNHLLSENDGDIK